MKKIIFSSLIFFSFFFSLKTLASEIQIEKAPYKRPIGFTLNLGGIASLTYEGRFIIGLVPNLSLVASPSYQSTIHLPIWGWRKQYGKKFSFSEIKRMNLGVGVRHHIFDYDSKDGFFIEYMARFGSTNIGLDTGNYFSIIPSILFGYSAVYSSHYTVSWGAGVAYEALIGQRQYDATKMFRNYFTYMIPFTAEISLGGLWDI